MTVFQHRIRDDISQRSHDAQRTGAPVPLAAHLGYFDQVGQYLLALNMLKDSALIVKNDPDGADAAAEFEWLADERDSALPASRCFEVLGDLLHIDDAEQFQLAFIDALKRNAAPMHRALMDLYSAVEDGRTSDDVPMSGSSIRFDVRSIEMARTSSLRGLVAEQEYERQPERMRQAG
jgi:hypothetical protein